MRGLIRMSWAAAAATLALLVPVAGQARAAAPVIAWTPSGHNYGSIDAGDTAFQEFTLTNSGGSASGTLSISLSGSAAFSLRDACSGTSLAPRKSCAVTVEYAPTTGGQSDTATLTASSKKAGAVSITLTGESTACMPLQTHCTGPGDLSLSPGTFAGTTDFGTKVYRYDYELGASASATQTFTVTNNGTAASNTLVLSEVGGTLFVFVLSNDTCSGSPLAPSGTCTFDIGVTAPPTCTASTDDSENVEVNAQDNFFPYIHLALFATCT